eukprot:242954_1
MGTVDILLSLSLIISTLAMFVYTFGTNNAHKSYTQRNATNIAKFFYYSTIFCNLFNCISCVSTTIDFIITIKEPYTHIVATILWYIAKIILFWIVSTRFVGAFRHTRYMVNRKLIMSFNVIISLIPFINLFTIKWNVITGYVFIVFCILYIILSCWIQIQFNKRFREIIISHNQVYTQLPAIDHDDDGCVHVVCELLRNIEHSTDKEIDENAMTREYFEIMTRFSTLHTWIILSMVAFVCIRMLFERDFAMLIMSLDSLINIVCLLLMFRYCKFYYHKICANDKFKCDYICRKFFWCQVGKYCVVENNGKIDGSKLCVDINDGVDLIVNGLIHKWWKSKQFANIRMPSNHVTAIIRLYSKPCEIWDNVFQTMNDDAFWMP